MPTHQDQKNDDIQAVVRQALKNGKVLAELLANLKSKQETIRWNSFQALLHLSEQHPEALYPRWDDLVDLIDGDNAYWKFSAVHLIANLVRVDTQNKFEKIFDKYYGLLNDSVIVAGHVTANSGKIAKAKPHLQAKITDALLNIDKTQQKHKDLIKSGAIQACDAYFEDTQDKERILEFVRNQRDCESPKTRKIAKQFLKKWDQNP